MWELVLQLLQNKKWRKVGFVGATLAVGYAGGPPAVALMRMPRVLAAHDSSQAGVRDAVTKDVDSMRTAQAESNRLLRQIRCVLIAETQHEKILCTTGPGS